uniref:nuclear pore complex protein Nup153 isoform X2 n=1 Tax=Myxine glutinosa TaxID=7769 RepID=UPI00358EEEEC
MAAEGGGKMRTKRRHGSAKPYARDKGLLHRVTENVKNYIPSWLQSYFVRHDENDVAGDLPLEAGADQSDSVEHTQYVGDDYCALRERNHVGSVAGNVSETDGTFDVPYPDHHFNNEALQQQHLSLKARRPIGHSLVPSRTSGSAFVLPSLNQSGHEPSVRGDSRDRRGTLAEIRELTEVHEFGSQCEDDSVSTTSGFSSRASDKDVAVNRGATMPLYWSLPADQKGRGTPQSVACSSKKPSFKLSTFDSPRSAGREVRFNKFADSTFYPGKTTYGGASASRMLRKASNTPYQVPYRTKVRAQPAKVQGSGVTSVTAQRILETIEKMSSPVLDARKIPTSSLFPLSSSFVEKSLISPSYHNSLAGSQMSFQSPPVEKLLTPTSVPISLKRAIPVRPSLGPARVLKRVAETSLPHPTDIPPQVSRNSLGGRTNQTVISEASSKPTSNSKCSKTSTANGVSRGFGEKKYECSSKQPAPRSGKNERRSEPCPFVEMCPKQQFTFTLPPAIHSSSSTSPSQHLTTSKSVGPAASVPPFTFSTPAIRATESTPLCSQHTPTFQFSSPLDWAGSRKCTSSAPAAVSMVQSTSESTATATKCLPPDQGDGEPESFFTVAKTLKTTGSVMDILGGGADSKKAKDGQERVPTKTLKSGSVMDILKPKKGQQKSSMDLTPSQSLSQTTYSSFGGKSLSTPGSSECLSCRRSNAVIDGYCELCRDKKIIHPLEDIATLRPPPGSWECDTCMVKNKADTMRCVACQVPRFSADTGPGFSSLLTPKLPNDTHTKLGVSLERAQNEAEWSCSTCKSQSKATDGTCQACKTAKTGSSDTLPPALSVGFGEQFKRAPGTWDCDVCLVQNKPDATVCAACSNSRPGSKPPSAIPGVTTNVTPTTSLSFGDKFKKAAGTWDCDVCLVQNKPDTLACVACTSPKPGSKPPPVQQVRLKPEPSPSQFKFGILSDAAPPTIDVATFKSSKSGDFKFGLHPETQTDTPTFSSPFQFGEQTSNLVITSDGKANEVHIGTALGSLTKPANDGGSVKTGFEKIGKSTDVAEPTSIAAVNPIQPVYSGFGSSQSNASPSVAKSLGATQAQPAFGLPEDFTFGTTEASSHLKAPTTTFGFLTAPNTTVTISSVMTQSAASVPSLPSTLSTSQTIEPSPSLIFGNSSKQTTLPSSSLSCSQSLSTSSTTTFSSGLASANPFISTLAVAAQPSPKAPNPSLAMPFLFGKPAQQATSTEAAFIGSNTATIAPLIFGGLSSGTSASVSTATNNSTASPFTFNQSLEAPAPAVTTLTGITPSPFVFGTSAKATTFPTTSVPTSAPANPTPAFNFGAAVAPIKPLEAPPANAPSAPFLFGANVGSVDPPISSAPPPASTPFVFGAGVSDAGAKNMPQRSSPFAFSASPVPGNSGVGFGASQSMVQPPAFGTQQPSVGVPTFGQVSSQTPAFGSLGQPSQQPAFSFPANQAPSFGAALPSMFGPSATSSQQPAFGTSANPAPGAGSGFQFNLNTAPSFNFGAATAGTAPAAPRGFSFGGAAVPPSNQPTHSYHGGSAPVSQFPTSGSSTIKNRNIKKAVRRRK